MYFKGTIIHTNSYRTHQKYEDQTVVVCGIGPSGLDAACELAPFAKQVYLSTRRGTWVTPRLGPNGRPFDTVAITRFNKFLMTLLPFRFVCYLIERFLNRRFDHALYGLKPNHRVLNQHATVNDNLGNYVLSGKIKIKKNISKITSSSVIFEDDEEVKCDAIIFGTGYEIAFPFLDDDIVSIENNTIKLYKHLFSPKIERPESLAFIGLVQPSGPIFPVAEMQTRWFVQLIQGTFN